MTGQTTLGGFSGDLSELTPAERSAYLAVERGDYGPREYQREQGYSSPGTVSNLLARARSKVDDGGNA
ncbi:sigma-70 family RNA polymerase sigma factor [Halostella salina]|uniref:sigma-70 family RNA polymerase sigma factor n=1 Tax=Halostella salina TaxID=1547897 RepID=UPI000EF82D2F|nr:sigma-70 family RNA polymerase sigma factor [Halostella salina]